MALARSLYGGPNGNRPLRPKGKQLRQQWYLPRASAPRIRFEHETNPRYPETGTSSRYHHTLQDNWARVHRPIFGHLETESPNPVRSVEHCKVPVGIMVDWIRGVSISIIRSSNNSSRKKNPSSMHKPVRRFYLASSAIRYCLSLRTM
jgi:hypothetical protein